MKTKPRSQQPPEAAIRIDEERCVYMNRFGALYDDRVTFASGVQGSYLRFIWHAPYYVAVLPVLPDGRIVLVSAFRHALRDWCIEVPKGFGRDGISPADIARDELLEETGFNSGTISSIRTIVVDPAFVATPCHLFRASLTGERQEVNRESTETIRECVVIAPDEAEQLVANGTIEDAVTLLLLGSHLKATGPQ